MSFIRAIATAILCVLCSYVVNASQNILSITHHTLSSQLSIPSGSSVYIAPNVTLTINNNLFLANCEIVLGSNARIIIQDSSTLDLRGCYLHGCDTMWDGIYATGTATIIVEQHSKIEDAMNGITVAGGQAQMRI